MCIATKAGHKDVKSGHWKAFECKYVTRVTHLNFWNVMNDESDMARRKKVFKLKSTKQIWENLKKSKQALQIELHATIEDKKITKLYAFFFYLSRL